MVGFISVLVNECFWFLNGDCNMSTYQIAKKTEMRQETINNLRVGKGSLASADLFVSRVLVHFPGAFDDIMRRARQVFKFGAEEDKPQGDL